MKSKLMKGLVIVALAGSLTACEMADNNVILQQVQQSAVWPVVY